MSLPPRFNLIRGGQEGRDRIIIPGPAHIGGIAYVDDSGVQVTDPAVLALDAPDILVNGAPIIRAVARGLDSVTEAAEAWTVSGFDALDTDYHISVTPNWPTVVWETDVTSSTFSVGFTVPAPADATLRWLVVRAPGI